LVRPGNGRHAAGLQAVPPMSPDADWLAELRRLHDESFRGTDWQTAVDELNRGAGTETVNPFSLVVPGAPPPLFNGDVEQIRPRRWALTISLNHQLGEQRVDPEPQALWEYWRNYNRHHWYSKFFHPITRLVWTALGQPEPEDPREYAASHILFVELCPYASRSFSLPTDVVARLVQSEPGFRLAARANRLLIDEAEPAFVLVNGSAACATVKAEFGNRLSWQCREYLSTEATAPGDSKTLRHYEGLLKGPSANIPVVGFLFLRTPRTQNSNPEIRQLAVAIRHLAQVR
jgi:hypothetical protein